MTRIAFHSTYTWKFARKKEGPEVGRRLKLYRLFSMAKILR